LRVPLPPRSTLFPYTTLFRSSMLYSSSRRNRGAALIIGFALVLILFALAFSFAGRLSANHQRLESDVAGERAYELAQTANTLKRSEEHTSELQSRRDLVCRLL